MLHGSTGLNQTYAGLNQPYGWQAVLNQMNKGMNRPVEWAYNAEPIGQKGWRLEPVFVRLNWDCKRRTGSVM